MKRFEFFAKSKLRACIATTLLSLFALPATAVAPVKFSQTFTRDFTFTACPYGNLSAESTVNVQGIAFRDASLNTTRVQLHFAVNTVITNPLNNKIATDFQSSDETFNVNDGSFVVRGLFESIRVPDEDVVAQVAGQIGFDGNGNVVFLTPLFQNSNTDALCAALQ